LRQKFIDKTIPQAELIGLRVPDIDARWNDKTNHYDIGKINWDEFHRVIAGHGPCNKQRINHHIKYHEDGAWIREAAEAYKKKKLKRESFATI
jgi:ring-1,2-phenylacetyl-CoA epoxidase subunit PaaA